jgi:putative membrane protein
VLAALNPSTDVWHFRPHPEVWLLIAALAGCYVYAVRAIGPNVVKAGERVVTRKQLTAFGAGMLLLWLASDWPVHDLAEQYLYSVHMVQHMVLSYFMPPLLLIATPEWLARLVVGGPDEGRAYRVVQVFTKPVVAGVLFNGWIMVTHIPGVVNSASTNGPVFHYSLHLVLVVLSLLMWTPVCGPFPELRIGPGAKMIYLFAQSVVPTVPAGWLTFADGAVYKVYDHSVRVWGLSVTDDQQLAGVFMKVGGSVYLWTITTVLFFRRFMPNWEAEQGFSRRSRPPEAEIGRTSEATLTYEQVTEEFDRHAAPASPTDA